MTVRPSFVSAAVLAVALAGASVAPAGAVTLPRLEADALGGKHVVLPTDAAGKPFMIVLAYTKEAGNDVKAWSRRLLDARAGHATLYVVVVADTMGLVSRRHIRTLVEGAAVGSAEQIAGNVLITFAAGAWHELVPGGAKQAAGVVVCDRGGSVVYARREAYSEAAAGDVERAAQAADDAR